MCLQLRCHPCNTRQWSFTLWHCGVLRLCLSHLLLSITLYSSSTLLCSFKPEHETWMACAASSPDCHHHWHWNYCYASAATLRFKNLYGGYKAAVIAAFKLSLKLSIWFQLSSCMKAAWKQLFLQSSENLLSSLSCFQAAFKQLEHESSFQTLTNSLSLKAAWMLSQLSSAAAAAVTMTPVLARDTWHGRCLKRRSDMAPP